MWAVKLSKEHRLRVPEIRVFRRIFEPDMKVVLVKWVPCHHGMVHLQVADGEECLLIWREAANIFNKQSHIADTGWPSRLGVGHGANNHSP
jgi:hypothetical protein